jgi:hypothetical protein
MLAIKKRGIAIAKDNREACLPASMTFAVETTGVEGNCQSRPGMLGFSSKCSSRAVYQYSLKLVLSDPEDGSPVLESYVATDGGTAQPNSAITYALCRGAVYRYPHAVPSQWVTIDMEK